ncbi:MAG: YceI family protein [Bacteroidota bacterium]
MKKQLLLIALSVLTLGATAQEWSIDNSHSSVKFKARYMMFSDVEGTFKKFQGTFTSSKSDFSDLQVNMTVDVASVNTDNEMRDNHLKADDFFNAEKFPSMSFKSTGIKSLGGGKFVLSGDLTIRDVTKRVDVPVVYGGTTKDPWGNTRAGFKATGKLNRKEFKLSWDTKNDLGEAVVGDEVEFTIDASLIKK